MTKRNPSPLANLDVKGIFGPKYNVTYRSPREVHFQYAEPIHSRETQKSSNPFKPTIMLSIHKKGKEKYQAWMLHGLMQIRTRGNIDFITKQMKVDLSREFGL